MTESVAPRGVPVRRTVRVPERPRHRRAHGPHALRDLRGPRPAPPRSRVRGRTVDERVDHRRGPVQKQDLVPVVGELGDPPDDDHRGRVPRPVRVIRTIERVLEVRGRVAGDDGVRPSR